MGGVVTGLTGAVGDWQRGKQEKISGRHARSYQHWERERLWDELERQLGPYAEAGRGATNKLMEMMGAGPGQMEQDPGYGFRLGEGTKALERGAAARGGQLSGAQGKALTKYGQELGSQEYGNFLNRYYQKMQPYMDVARVGMPAAGQIAAGPGAIQQLPQVPSYSPWSSIANNLGSSMGQVDNMMLMRMLSQQQPAPQGRGSAYGGTGAGWGLGGSAAGGIMGALGGGGGMGGWGYM